MKTKIIILSLCLFTLLFTQKIDAQITMGGGLAYGSEIENVGINITGQYFMKDNIAIEGSFTYYIPKSFGSILVLGADYSIKWYEINVNANYYFMEGKIKPYGLAGLNYSIISIPTFINFGSDLTNESSSKIGLNIGGGVDFDLGKKIIPFAQLKYVVGDFDQLQILAGARFILN